MQNLCDRLGRNEHGAPFDYEVNTVDAERISLPLPTEGSDASLDALSEESDPAEFGVRVATLVGDHTESSEYEAGYQAGYAAAMDRVRDLTLKISAVERRRRS